MKCRFVFCVVVCSFIDVIPNEPVLIFTYAYNRPEFIEIQHKTLKKFVGHPYKFIVFNDAKNSDDERAILTTCTHLGIECIRIPQIIHALPYLPRWPHEPADHGTVRCVNNIQYSLNKFGFNHNGIVVILDSDMFLIRPISFVESLKYFDMLAIPQRHFPIPFDGRRWIDHPSIHMLALNIKTMPNPRSLSVNCGMVDEIPVDAGGQMVLYRRAHPNLRVDMEPALINYIRDTNIDINDLKKRDLNEHEIHFIKQEPNFLINVEFVFHNKFLHYRSGTNWDQRPAEYHQKKLMLVKKFIENILNH